MENSPASRAGTRNYLTHVQGCGFSRIDRDEGSKATGLSPDRVCITLRANGNWDALSVAFSMTWMTSLRQWENWAKDTHTAGEREETKGGSLQSDVRSTCGSCVCFEKTELRDASRVIS